MARASPFAKSSTTALTSAFVVLSCFALRRAHPPAIPSCKRPQRPLGSAAVIAVLATIGEATTRLHSSALKLALLAIAQLLVRSSRSTSLPGDRLIASDLGGRLLTEPTVKDTAQHSSDQRCYPEQPKLSNRPPTHEQGRACATGRIDRRVGER